SSEAMIILYCSEIVFHVMIASLLSLLYCPPVRRRSASLCESVAVNVISSFLNCQCTPVSTGLVSDNDTAKFVWLMTLFNTDAEMMRLSSSLTSGNNGYWSGLFPLKLNSDFDAVILVWNASFVSN